MQWFKQTLIVTLMTIITGTSQAADSFVFKKDKGYSVAVFIAGNESNELVTNGLNTGNEMIKGNHKLVLQSLDKNTLVEIVEWESVDEAERYRAPYFPSIQAYWQRAFSMSGQTKKADASYAITLQSAVQWSEFLLRYPEHQSQLQTTVNAMVTGMVLGGPETLRSVQQLISKGGLSLGLLGIWSEPEGFHVFEKENTFGSKPYWSELADNAHWMMSVVSID